MCPCKFWRKPSRLHIVRDLLPTQRPGLLLAPMQDVTDLPFMRLMARYGGPDLFVTEYFRVTRDSKPEPQILRSITENETGIPVMAQIIGQDVEAMVRTARALERHPVAGIDLNLGCPAPIVCRKHAGGGLLRHPERVDALVGALRQAVDGRFTVKCRAGFDSPDEFPRLLEIFQKHALDGLTIHARTVREGYKTAVHPECVAAAVRSLPFPVIANGNVVNARTGLAYLRRTGAAGLMIGRGAIRHPWIFDELRASFSGAEAPGPRGRDLLGYIRELYEITAAFHPVFHELRHVQKMKRYLGYIAGGVDREFEHHIRRVVTPAEFDAVCRRFLDHDEPLPCEPPHDSPVFCGFRDLTVTEAEPVS
ncbi:MAG TPA: dihydrouridine synthase [Verrucomicrobiales bacterium]|nr:dihydrouridine synthase [Verrucomicrobiales bacterium]